MSENTFINYSTATSMFVPFAGLEIESIWCETVDECLDKVVLRFAKDSLVIKAEADDDSVQLFISSNYDIDHAVQAAEPGPAVLSKYIGQKFGWGWVTVNQQNYFDGVLLSFNGIVPNLLLNVIASSLRVFEVREIIDISE